jgi:hypothetical protein
MWQMKGWQMKSDRVIELQALWDRLLGPPAPDVVQFDVWAAQHSPELIAHGIVRTAEKNLSLNRQMDPDYRLRYCTTVMRNYAVKGGPMRKVDHEI